MLSFVTVFVALFAAACGAPFFERVQNGTEVNASDVPWSASIQYVGQHIGSGVIISRRFVLTTASVVDELLADNVRVRVGSPNHDAGGLLKAVRDITVHQNYSQLFENDNDIALLTFRYLLTLGPNNRAIPLAHPDNLLHSNFTYIVSGWILPEEDQDDLDVPDTLQAIQLRLFNHAGCSAAHGNFTEGPAQGQARVTRNMFCGTNAEHGGNSVCAGSIGSPVVHVTSRGPLLSGLASWNAGCGADAPPGVFTRIGNYINWLNQTASTQLEIIATEETEPAETHLF